MDLEQGTAEAIDDGTGAQLEFSRRTVLGALGLGGAGLLAGVAQVLTGGNGGELSVRAGADPGTETSAGSLTSAQAGIAGSGVPSIQYSGNVRRRDLVLVDQSIEVVVSVSNTGTGTGTYAYDVVVERIDPPVRDWERGEGTIQAGDVLEATHEFTFRRGGEYIVYLNGDEIDSFRVWSGSDDDEDDEDDEDSQRVSDPDGDGDQNDDDSGGSGESGGDGGDDGEDGGNEDEDGDGDDGVGDEDEDGGDDDDEDGDSDSDDDEDGDDNEGGESDTDEDGVGDEDGENDESGGDGGDGDGDDGDKGGHDRKPPRRKKRWRCHGKGKAMGLKRGNAVNALQRSKGRAGCKWHWRH